MTLLVNVISFYFNYLILYWLFGFIFGDLYAFNSVIGKSNEFIDGWNAYEIWMCIWMFLCFYFTSTICMNYVRIMNFVWIRYDL